MDPPLMRGRPLAQHSPEKRRTLAEEVSLYSPRAYSPSQQRNFYDVCPPTLAKHADIKPRPKSDLVSRTGVLDGIIGSHFPSGKPNSVEPVARASRRGHEQFNRASQSNSHQGAEKKKEASARGQSRVQAAISAFNARDKEAELQKKSNTKNIEVEFEKLLVSNQNILPPDF